LLVVAGLLIRSFVRLQQVEPGFNSKNVLTMQLSLPLTRYPDEQRQVAFFQQLLQRIEALPNVESAGVVNSLPLSGQGAGITFQVAGAPPAAPGQQLETQYRVVSPDYFKAMSIPVMRGRVFGDRDNLDAPGAVILNQAMAKRYFPNEDPLGKRIGFGSGPFWCEVIGVVGNVRHYKLAADPEPEIYLSNYQDPWRYMTLVIRTKNSNNIMGEVRKEILAVDKDQPVYNIRPMEEVMSESVAQPRFNLWLLSIFASVALLLAIVGIYGVMSYLVVQRSQEIGVRLALGADRTQILKLVVGQGMILTLLGVVVGLVAAFALTRTMSSLLFGVTATDPITFIAVSVLMLAVAVIANFIPAIKATKVNPLIALRNG
jgi:putative ABC transport system permease protein